MGLITYIFSSTEDEGNAQQKLSERITHVYAIADLK